MAVVVELIHTATLAHDDVIDHAEIRRGRPSINAKWGDQTTVLTGDWLYTVAMETALTGRSFEVLDTLIQSTRAMTEGELIQQRHIGDLAISRERYFEILRHKTAYLFGACTKIGGLMGGATRGEQDALRLYGINLGTAFQLIDDVLDCVSSEAVLGKAAGNDLCEGKLTLPFIDLMQNGDRRHIGMIQLVVQDGNYSMVKRQQLVTVLEWCGTLGRARSEARKYALRACSCIRDLPDSQYRDVLAEIARFTVERTG